MYRDREEEIDETTEISLEDTQEYRVAGNGDELRDDPNDDFEEDAYEEEAEFEEESFDDEEEFVDEEEPYEDEELEYEEDLEEPEAPGVEKEPTESISVHLKAAGAAMVSRAKKVKLPDTPDMPDVPSFDRKLTGIIAGIVLVTLAVGFGAYFLGKGSGDDVNAASLQGETAGKQAGALEGAAKGYPAGYAKGRDKGFSKAYEPAYLLNFKRAFEQAGLDVPTSKEIDVPEP